MKQAILSNLENPGQLERMYRENKSIFRNAFNAVFPDIRENTAARIWNERLNFENDEISWGTARELSIIIAIAVVAGFLAKLPDLLGIDHEYFYTRNISFIVFPALTVYFAWKQKTEILKLASVAFVFIISAVFINTLPPNSTSDTLMLSCMHLPLLGWAVLGYVFTGDPLNNSRRIDYLRYNGDLLVMAALIVISGAILAGVSFGLFQLIGINIEYFFSGYIAVWGLAAVPIVGTYLVQSNPQLVNKVSPVIAKVFTPLVLAMLVVYLAAVFYTGKDPYNDREFLMIFNLLLIGVMAIILFSVAGTSKSAGSKINTVMLFSLSVVTILVNGIALSAILYRIAGMGITPNRLAVLGSNLLILTNLFLVTFRLYNAIRKSGEISKVEGTIATYLPFYAAWTVIVIFAFPFLFNFR